MTADPIAAFAFSAQSQTGEQVSGTINASSVDAASHLLRDLQLRVIELDPIRNIPRPRRMGADDFQTFNTQLAHLTTAGLPVEKSLRLIADDMRSGRLAETVRQVAVNLESGRSLPEAFALHADQFPALYSEVLTAGMRTGNLAGMLLSLGRHLDLVKRLHRLLWTAVSYPLIVFFSLILIVAFLGIEVFPRFKETFASFHVDLPVITRLMIAFSDFLVANCPVLVAVVVALLVAIPLLWRLLSPIARQRTIETIIFPLPLVGHALIRNLQARWCDALKMGVQAGLDLPAAITMAAQAVGSPQLTADGAILVEAISAGRPLDNMIRTRLIPLTVVTVLSLAAGNNDLPGALDTLSIMFQQQAEMKMAMIPTILTPLMIMLIAAVIGFVVMAMFAPMIALIQAVAGPMK